MRGSPDFKENIATMKSKDSTVSRTCYQQKYVPRARKIMTTHEHCRTKNDSTVVIVKDIPASYSNITQV